MKNLKSPIESQFFVKLRRRDKSISDEFQICLLLKPARNMIIWVFVSLQNVIFPPFIINNFCHKKLKLKSSIESQFFGQTAKEG